MLSYTQTKEGDLKADFRGFVYAVDAKFESSSHTLPAHDPRSPSRQPAGQSGYSGHAKVLDQLIWTDVYGLCESGQSLSLLQMWELARSSRHPWGVYVGPTIASQRKAWLEIGAGWNALSKEAKERVGSVPVREGQ